MKAAFRESYKLLGGKKRERERLEGKKLDKLPNGPVYESTQTPSSCSL